MPLKVRCSRKCAVPLEASSSYLDPASIKTPTVAVSPWPPSDATRTPFFKVETSVAGAFRTYDGKEAAAEDDWVDA